MRAKVNNLPVLTFGKLKLNSAELEYNNGSTKVEKLVAELLSDDGEKTFACEMPENISVKKDVPTEEVDSLFESLNTRVGRENVVAGKFPMYNEQLFATGMGAEADALFDEAGILTDVYEVSAGSESAAPVIFKYDITEGTNGLVRRFIHVKSGAAVSIVFLYAASAEEFEKEVSADEVGKKGIVGASTRIYVEEGASVKLASVQLLNKGFTFFEDFGTIQCEDASLKFTKVDLGAGKVYEGFNANQKGDESDFDCAYGFIGEKDSFTDINYNDVFFGKKTNGVMRFNGALIDNAFKNWRGTIDFRQGCVAACGDEEENVLLFGEDIVNKTIPLILCEEEDVEGRHASTLGKIADDQLFYMQTRGISLKEAEELIVRASVNSVNSGVPSSEIRSAVRERIDAIFERRSR